MTGEGRRFKYQQQERIICPECWKDLAKGSLMMQRQTQHYVDTGRWGLEGDEAERGGENKRTYKMEFPKRAGPIPCPVEGCSGRALTRTSTRVHLWHRHIRDTVVILEEGNLPHPLCLLCDMLVM